MMSKLGEKVFVQESGKDKGKKAPLQTAVSSVSILKVGGWRK
jgi:hypothetical protein